MKANNKRGMAADGDRRWLVTTSVRSVLPKTTSGTLQETFGAKPTDRKYLLWDVRVTEVGVNGLDLRFNNLRTTETWPVVSAISQVTCVAAGDAVNDLITDTCDDIERATAVLTAPF